MILVALVPILRAGLGMLEGTLDVLPFAVTWHLGLYRNEETLQPVQYYNKMREEQVSQAGTVFVLDPMLATGGSLVAAIKTVKDKGAKNVKVCIFDIFQYNGQSSNFSVKRFFLFLLHLKELKEYKVNFQMLKSILLD